MLACPRCRSPLAGDAPCPRCGAELDRHRELACPRCATTLQARLVGEVVIDECPSCLGLFLDHVAIQRVIADRDPARADALLAALPRHELATVVKPGEKMYLPCPSCHTMMNRKQFALGAGVIIDVCRQHGTFFDVGELPAIIDFVMHGGLEKAAKREAEHHRDQQRADRANRAAAARVQAKIDFQAHPRAGSGQALVELLFSLFG